MAKKELSAKDKAFEKERIKYRRIISQLKVDNVNKDQKIKRLEKRINDLKENEKELNTIIQRLLEYCDLDEEFMRKKIHEEKFKQAIMDTINKTTKQLNMPSNLIGGNCDAFVDVLATLICLNNLKQ